MTATPYKFEPYDVLQISKDKGKTWADFGTLRDESEAFIAWSRVVRRVPVRFREHPDEQWRITRNQQPVFTGTCTRKLGR